MGGCESQTVRERPVQAEDGGEEGVEGAKGAKGAKVVKFEEEDADGVKSAVAEAVIEGRTAGTGAESPTSKTCLTADETAKEAIGSSTISVSQAFRGGARGNNSDASASPKGSVTVGSITFTGSEKDNTDAELEVKAVQSAKILLNQNRNLPRHKRA